MEWRRQKPGYPEMYQGGEERDTSSGNRGTPVKESHVLGEPYMWLKVFIKELKI